MAITLSPFAIFGLAVGGAVLLVAATTTALILLLRRKHKRTMMLMDARGARRLSGYPGGHVSMTDYDWLSLPRTRTLRSSRRVPARYPRPYTPIASRESLPRHQKVARPPRALTSESHSTETNAQQASWPLPRRLTRSNVLPLAQLRGPMSPVTERGTPKHPGPSVTPNNGVIRMVRQSPDEHGSGAHQVALPTGVPMDSPRSNISSKTALALTPKPLFHDKRRSSSLGTLSKPSNAARKQSGFYVVDSQEPDMRHARLPRSTSLHAQQIHSAPTEPLPQLPLNVAKLRSYQNIRSPTEHRGSEHSLLSGDTSILNHGRSKCFSQAETNITSVSMISPTGLGSMGLGISSEEGFKWDSGEVTRSASPIDALKQPSVRPQLKTQDPYRASIQQSLPRSASSNLSLSLLDRSPFRHPSDVTVNKVDMAKNDQTKLKPNQGLEIKTRRGVGPSSSLSRKSMINIYEDPRTKRSSAILQNVSRNQVSPLHDGVKSRPLSVATSDPFKWETEKPLKAGKPSAMKGRARGHKRNSCVRICNIPIYIPAPRNLQPTVEEHEELPKKTTTVPAFTFGKPIQPLPIRLPSRLIFDPLLTPTPKPRSTRLPQRTSLTKDSPTFFLLNLHNPSSADADSPSPFPTPTRRSALGTRTSGTNPNRRKPIFCVPTAPEFIFTTPEKQTPLPHAPSEPTIQIPKNPEIELSQPKPSSTLFPFPSPPHPFVPMGPRALPPTAWRRRSNSRSPTRVGKTGPLGSSTARGDRGRRGSKDLRKSVIALRRMNSDAQEFSFVVPQRPCEDRAENRGSGEGERRDGNSGESGKGHRRYLSLGDGDGDGEDDAGDEEKENEEGEFERVGIVGGVGGVRGRSETSLVFERVVGGSSDLGGERDLSRDLGDGNIFGIASRLHAQAPRKERRDAADVLWQGTPGSLYDENGFLRDGRGSPVRLVYPVLQ